MIPQFSQLPAPASFDADGMLNAMSQGRQWGQQDWRRKTANDMGTALAAGDWQGAQGAAAQSGDPALIMQTQQAKNAQSQFEYEQQQRLVAAVGNAAQAAKTPEQYAQLIAASDASGHPVPPEYRDFNTGRTLLISRANSGVAPMDAQLRQQQLAMGGIDQQLKRQELQQGEMSLNMAAAKQKMLQGVMDRLGGGGQQQGAPPPPQTVSPPAAAPRNAMSVPGPSLYAGPSAGQAMPSAPLYPAAAAPAIAPQPSGGGQQFQPRAIGGQVPTPQAATGAQQGPDSNTMDLALLESVLGAGTARIFQADPNYQQKVEYSKKIGTDTAGRVQESIQSNKMNNLIDLIGTRLDQMHKEDPASLDASFGAYNSSPVISQGTAAIASLPSQIPLIGRAIDHGVTAAEKFTGSTNYVTREKYRNAIQHLTDLGAAISRDAGGTDQSQGVFMSLLGAIQKAPSYEAAKQILEDARSGMQIKGNQWTGQPEGAPSAPQADAAQQIVTRKSLNGKNYVQTSDGNWHQE
jgi:hypothetical protein